MKPSKPLKSITLYTVHYIIICDILLKPTWQNNIRNTCA